MSPNKNLIIESHKVLNEPKTFRKIKRLHIFSKVKIEKSKITNNKIHLNFLNKILIKPSLNKIVDQKSAKKELKKNK